MIIDRLRTYWTMCVIARRSEDPTQRRAAINALREMPDKRSLRFVDLAPKITVKS